MGAEELLFQLLGMRLVDVDVIPKPHHATGVEPSGVPDEVCQQSRVGPVEGDPQHEVGRQYLRHGSLRRDRRLK